MEPPKPFKVLGNSVHLYQGDLDSVMKQEPMNIRQMVCDALNEVVAAYYRGEFHEAVTDAAE